MYWVRVDNRLIHGQIIETWLPFTKSRRIIVANDDVAGDALRQDIMLLAIPQDIGASFVTVEEAFKALPPQGPDEAMVLFASCCDAKRAFESGLPVTSLNIGNLHYGPGKRQICAHVALSQDDEVCLQYFTGQGVRLDFRCVPNEPVQVAKAW